jgi:hypothetical protein
MHNCTKILQLLGDYLPQAPRLWTTLVVFRPPGPLLSHLCERAFPMQIHRFGTRHLTICKICRWILLCSNVVFKSYIFSL